MGESKASKKRATKEIIYTITLITLTVSILIGALYLYFHSTNPPDPVSFCPQSGALGHVVVLIDRTTPLGFIQKKSLYAQMDDIVKERVKAGERLTIFVIDEDITKFSEPIFDKCNPGDGSTKNQWTDAPDKYAKLYKNFLKEFKNIEFYFDSPQPRQFSPIMEMLQIASIDGFSNHSIKGGKKLIVISDMLHNTLMYSQYTDKIDFQQFKQTDYFKKVRTNLADVEVEIAYLMHSPPLQNRGHAKFWEDYFNEMGARLTAVQLIQG